jgi:hypothetical protein
MSGNNNLILQARDRHLLEELAVMRVLDREQAKVVAGFGSTTRANTRLLALVRAGLLRRFFIGSGGGRRALYALSLKGAQVVEVPVRGPRRPQDALLVADYFVGHQLAVNGIYCALKYGTIPVPHVTFHRWLSFFEPVVPGISLIPDGYVEFMTPAGIIACWKWTSAMNRKLSGKERLSTICNLRSPGSTGSNSGMNVSGCSSLRTPRDGYIRSGRRSPRSRKKSSGSQRSRPSAMGASRRCGTAPRNINQHHLSRQHHEVLLPMRKDDGGGGALLRNVRQIV